MRQCQSGPPHDKLVSRKPGAIHIERLCQLHDLDASMAGDIFEREARQPYARTIADIKGALERAGIIFIDENDEGPGLRMKKI